MAVKMIFKMIRIVLGGVDLYIFKCLPSIFTNQTWCINWGERLHQIPLFLQTLPQYFENTKKISGHQFCRGKVWIQIVVKFCPILHVNNVFGPVLNSKLIEAKLAQAACFRHAYLCAPCLAWPLLSPTFSSSLSSAFDPLRRISRDWNKLPPNILA